MSSITITDAIDFALRGADTSDLDNLRLNVERALYGREEAIAERIIGEVVDRFGVDEDAVRERLAETGMAVNSGLSSSLDDAEGEIEDDEDDEDGARDAASKSAPEAEPTVAEAAAALIRAITARLG